MKRTALVLLGVLLGYATVGMATDLTITITASTKRAALSADVALRETVDVTITNLSGALPANLVVGIIDGTNLVAAGSSFTNNGGNAAGELNLNTEELTNAFSTASVARGKKTFDLIVWDSNEKSLLVNDRIDILYNPYTTNMALPSSIASQWTTADARYVNHSDQYVMTSLVSGGLLSISGTYTQTFTLTTGTLQTAFSTIRFPFPNGTADQPSITYTNDPNTGLYRPGDDTNAMSVGGLTAMFWSGDGVAIGTNLLSTDTIAYKLHVHKQTPTANEKLFGITTGNGTERVWIDEDGDMDIDGQMNAGGTLIYGSYLAMDSGGSGVQIYNQSAGSDVSYGAGVGGNCIFGKGTSSYNALTNFFYANSTLTMVQDENGLAIGTNIATTANVAYRLHAHKQTPSADEKLFAVTTGNAVEKFVVDEDGEVVAGIWTGDVIATNYLARTLLYHHTANASTIFSTGTVPTNRMARTLTYHNQANASTIFSSGTVPTNRMARTLLYHNTANASTIFSTGTVPTNRMARTLLYHNQANASTIFGSGTIPSARVSGSYSGITGLGAQAQKLDMNGNQVILDEDADSYLYEVGDDTTGVVIASVEVGHWTSLGLGINTNLGTQQTLDAALVLGPGTPTTASQGIQFGSDVSLYRSEPNVLKTDDTVDINGRYAVVGPATTAYFIQAGTGEAVDVAVTFGTAYSTAPSVTVAYDNTVVGRNEAAYVTSVTTTGFTPKGYAGSTFSWQAVGVR